MDGLLPMGAVVSFSLNCQEKPEVANETQVQMCVAFKALSKRYIVYTYICIYYIIYYMQS